MSEQKKKKKRHSFLPKYIILLFFKNKNHSECMCLYCDVEKATQSRAKFVTTRLNEKKKKKPRSIQCDE